MGVRPRPDASRPSCAANLPASEQRQRGHSRLADYLGPKPSQGDQPERGRFGADFRLHVPPAPVRRRRACRHGACVSRKLHEDKEVRNATWQAIIAYLAEEAAPDERPPLALIAEVLAVPDLSIVEEVWA